MSKRDPKEDIPRRIYKTTIERINKHLVKHPRETKKPSTRKGENKGDFNKFLEMLLDNYESIQSAEIFYATTLHRDPSEARGEAIQQSVKLKKPVEWPKMVIVVGSDEQA
jgi:hypothetical protein